MTVSDQQKWDAIYRKADAEVLGEGNAWLIDQLEAISPGPALDVACGRGRNAVYMARQGFAVDAVDISNVAIEQLQRLAAQRALSIHAWQQDLLADPSQLEFPRNDYQVIVMMHFVAPTLMAHLPALLRPGGYLLIEQHLQWPTEVSGPKSTRFRLAAGELLAGVSGLSVVYQSEGLITPREGKPSAVARLAAVKP